MASRSPHSSSPSDATRRVAVKWRRVERRVYDVRQPGFAAECDRQARLIGDAQAGGDGAEAEAWSATSDTSGWV